MSTNNSSDDLRNEMNRLGAREFEQVALSMDPARGLAALAQAVKKGADNPIPYAIKLFDSPDWHPSGEIRRQATNVSVERDCPHCGGDRFLVVTDDPSALYGESYAPCGSCNSAVDTQRWVGQERRVTAPL